MKFCRDYIIGVEDIGKDNKITNWAFLKYLEEIACSHSALCDFGVNDIPAKQKAWLLMDWKLKVLERPIYDQKLEIKTWARIMPQNSYFCYRDFEVYCENKLVAIATSKWVLFDFKCNRITKLTGEIYNPYEPEDTHVFENEEIEKIFEPKEQEKEILYEVKRADIDINRHVHNLNYLKWAYEILPENVYFGNELNNVRIMYKHQVLFGQKVRCYYTQEMKKHTITIKSEDNKIVHSIVELN